MIALIQMISCMIIILPMAILLGNYIAKIFSNETTILTRFIEPIELFTYKICSINHKKQQNWKRYTISMILFHVVGFIFVMLILLAQNLLPRNDYLSNPIEISLAFNTAISYITNSNWQAYAGEDTMSYFSQMTALTVQNFLSASIGLILAIALIRGITSNASGRIGNFYSDLIKAILYIFLPISIVIALFLILQGVPQNFNDYIVAYNLNGNQQILPQGPAASQIAIKQLGTNGGGFFGANSAHPYENPNIISNILQNILMLLLPISLIFTYGKMIKNPKHSWTILGALMFLFFLSLIIVIFAEQTPNPLLIEYNINENLYGKELRFGVDSSIIWSVTTTATSSGATNSVLDSYMPLSKFIFLFNMMIGEVIFGGVGSGLYNLIIFIIITVFISGLMIGRTPQYLGKKIEIREIRLAILAILAIPLGIFAIGAISFLFTTDMSNNSHNFAYNFTKILYAHTSSSANNGSAMLGFDSTNIFNNIILALEMLVGRFLVIIPMLAIAGSLSKKNIIVASTNNLPLHGAQFATLLIAVLLINVLIFFPVLMLGPGLSHFELIK